MKDFDSFSDYLRFAGAKEFTYKDPQETSFTYKKNRWERIGSALSKPVMLSLDVLIRNKRNPLFIAALTITALFATTLLFYPSVFAGILAASVVIGLKIAAFTLTQATIVGLCLRTLGRLNNRELMEPWTEHKLTPQAPGSLRL